MNSRSTLIVPKLAIIIPVLNEEREVAACIRHLHALIHSRDDSVEVLFVDGGSGDNTCKIINQSPFKLVNSEPGRAVQMNVAAAQLDAPLLLFLHVDSCLPSNALERLQCDWVQGNRVWGRFDVAIASDSILLRCVSTMMNIRSRLSGIATGDQGIFVTRPAFSNVGGYPEQALMEDIALTAALKKLTRPFCVRDKMSTSARRWQERGAVTTILLMWRLRLAYFFGASPENLARKYRHVR